MTEQTLKEMELILVQRIASGSDDAEKISLFKFWRSIIQGFQSMMENVNTTVEAIDKIDHATRISVGDRMDMEGYRIALASVVTVHFSMRAMFSDYNLYLEGEGK